MDTMATQPVSAPRAALAPSILLLVGLGVVYLPTFWDLFHGAWSSDRNAHGPIVMTVAFGFLYFRMRQLLSQERFERRPAPLAGAAALLLGLVLYVLGRSQGVLLFEVGSLIPVLSGVLIAFYLSLIHI